MSQQLRVLVVGASVAGPMTAYWLARAGAKVTVIERYPSLRKGGQNVDIRTVGVTVMRRTPGMEAAVRSKKADFDSLAIVRDDNTPYGVITPTGDPDRQTLISEYEILRGDLSKIMYDMTKDDPNITYVFDEQVSAIHHHSPSPSSTDQQESDSPDNETISVSFLNNHLPSPSPYDLVVACDGTTSRTRAMGLGCGKREYVESLNIWAGFGAVPGDLLATEGDSTASGRAVGYTAPGGRLLGMSPYMTYSPSSSEGEMKKKTRVFFLSAHRPPQESLDAFRAAQRASSASGDDPEAMKRFIAERYSNIGWVKAPTILDSIMLESSPSTLEEDALYTTEMVKIRPPKLYRGGHFAMVGDAGYGTGMTGTGTSLALLGGYVLAGEVAKAIREGAGKGSGPKGLEEALKRYDEVMGPIVEEQAKVPTGFLKIMLPQSRLAVWLRNQAFAFLCWSGVLGLVARFGGAAFGEAREKCVVPEYEFGVGHEQKN